MARIKLVTPVGETSVGMIYKTNEALHMASLLQALCTTPNFEYWVEFKDEKGNNIRRQPQRFDITVGNIKPLYDLLRHLYINDVVNTGN